MEINKELILGKIKKLVNEGYIIRDYLNGTISIDKIYIYPPNENKVMISINNEYRHFLEFDEGEEIRQFLQDMIIKKETEKLNVYLVKSYNYLTS